MVYSPVPPATAAHPAAPDTVTPAPWVPYTRAGCDVGEVATANQELENTAVDIPKVFGAGSPEDQQLNADTDSFKDAETADYVGIGVHCAQGNAFCADAKGVKFGQTSASPTAVADLLPDEPGGYNGFQALFGHRYVAPQLGAGTPNLTQQRRPRSPTRPATWSTRTATRSTARSSILPTRASPASARSTRRRSWPTWRTCWSPASPW